MGSIVPNGALTGSRMEQAFIIDAENGHVFWKGSRGSVAAGKQAGTLTKGGNNRGGGYLKLDVDGRSYRLHQIIWAYHTGRWPDGEIDHINRNRSDNRIANLRDSTVSQNRVNRPAQSNNKSGFKWVSWDRGSNSWCAKICARRKGRRVTLYNSYHKTPEEAFAVASAKAKELHGKFFNNGK